MTAVLLAAVFLLAGGAGALPAPKRPVEGVPAGWRAQAQAEIRGLEYRPKAVPAGESDGALHTVRAPNRAHNFRLSFTPEGVRVTPRTRTGPDWSWGLQLTGIGRAGDLCRPEAARLRVDGDRVELVRGRLTEWYINDERGLEQGFTLEEPWPGADDELVVRMAVTGSLRPKMEAGHRAIGFAPPDGATVLRFGQLLAWDASGRELPVRFGLADGGVEIAVATTGARYPIVIDPLATSVTWTATGDREGAYFGTSVAGAGDVNGDGYDDVIVGAPDYSNDQSGEGAVFVFYGSPSGLRATHDWKVESNQADAAFGTSVASAGDVNGDGIDDVIIGAPGYANGGANAGAVFVYYGSKPAGLSANPSSGTGPSLQPDWQVLFSQAGANFGTSVATAGDVNNDGVDDVIVGAPDYTSDPLNQVSEGAAFVYHGPIAGVGTTASWKAESDQANAVFGTSVATAGDVDGNGYADVIVGAPGYTNDQEKEGAAFVYYGRLEDNGLSMTAKWTVDSNQTDAGLGWSVASAGDVNADGFDDVIVGVPYYDNIQTNVGAALVYHGSVSGLSTDPPLPSGPAPKPDWRGESGQALGYFGISVASAGDVDADGFDEVIVGADFYDNGQEDEGAAFVFHGSAGGLKTTFGWTGESNQEDSYFGSAVAGAGDVDKDGFADVVIGVHWYDRNEYFECGAAFVYRGVARGSFFLIPNSSGSATLIYLD